MQKARVWLILGGVVVGVVVILVIWRAVENHFAALREAGRQKGMQEAAEQIQEAEAAKQRAAVLEKLIVERDNQITAIKEEIAQLESRIGDTRRVHAKRVVQISSAPDNPVSERKSLCAELRQWAAAKGITIQCEP